MDLDNIKTLTKNVLNSSLNLTILNSALKRNPTQRRSKAIPRKIGGFQQKGELTFNHVLSQKGGALNGSVALLIGC